MMVDINKIITTLSSEHNFRINSDDPIIDVIYLNKAILEDYVDGVYSKISQSINNISINEERVSQKLSKLLSEGHTRQNSTLEKILLRHIDDINTALAQSSTRSATTGFSNVILWLIITFLLGLILGGAVVYYFFKP